ncbi:hypothetical protein MMIN_17890 [Mycolicibacter minnesotensis]|nr:hypothetical protein MMIN_17890 [Mycolicibacter minnesotensis]
MVKEAPGTDERALPLGQGSAHVEGAASAEWNIAGLQHLDVICWRCRTGELIRGGFQIAQLSTSALRVTPPA